MINTTIKVSKKINKTLGILTRFYDYDSNNKTLESLIKAHLTEYPKLKKLLRDNKIEW